MKKEEERMRRKNGVMNTKKGNVLCVNHIIRIKGKIKKKKGAWS